MTPGSTQWIHCQTSEKHDSMSLLVPRRQQRTPADSETGSPGPTRICRHSSRPRAGSCNAQPSSAPARWPDPTRLRGAAPPDRVLALARRCSGTPAGPAAGPGSMSATVRYGPSGSGRAGTRIVVWGTDKPMLLISSSHEKQTAITMSESTVTWGNARVRLSCGLEL